MKTRRVDMREKTFDKQEDNILKFFGNRKGQSIVTSGGACFGLFTGLFCLQAFFFLGETRLHHVIALFAAIVPSTQPFIKLHKTTRARGNGLF